MGGGGNDVLKNATNTNEIQMLLAGYQKPAKLGNIHIAFSRPDSPRTDQMLKKQIMQTMTEAGDFFTASRKFVYTTRWSYLTYIVVPYLYTISKLTDNILSSVADPDMNPDPYVFGPPGSGSGSFYPLPIKNSSKNLDSYYFATSFWLWKMM
jgi:hypothetical protein